MDENKEIQRPVRVATGRDKGSRRRMSVRKLSMHNDLWKISREHSLFYTEDPEIKNRLFRWADVKVNAWYYNPRGKLVGWQFLIANKIRRRVAKLAGIDIPKAKGRIRRAKENIAAGKAIHHVLKDRPVKMPAATTQ